MVKVFFVATIMSVMIELLFFRSYYKKKFYFRWWGFFRVMNNLLFGYFSFGLVAEVLIQNSNFSSPSSIIFPAVFYLMSMFFLTWIITGIFFGWLRFKRIERTKRGRVKKILWVKRQDNRIFSWLELHMAIGYFSAILFFLDWFFQEKNSDGRNLI